MFCDLVGSTAIASRLDPEDWRNLVSAYLDEAWAAVAGFGGHVLKRLGDGLMALFGYPQAQENDAERAVRAALMIQRALACRILGSTCLVQGNLIEARSLLEQALDNCLPDRDPSARFRFGHDPGAAAAAYLAIAAWHLGEVERARRLAEQAVETAAELGHVPTSANAYTYKLLLETRRDDPAAALRSAQMLIALAACRTRVCG